MKRSTAWGNLLLGVVTLSAPGCSVAEEDIDFDLTVKKPAYTEDHPKVLFDEAHGNHTGYKPFIELVTNDGYVVTPNRQRFRGETLSDFEILVIAHPGRSPPKFPVFAEDECDAILKWVSSGGALLLITDLGPTSAATEEVSKLFGVEISKSTCVEDRDPANHAVPIFSNNLPPPFNFDREWLVFSRDNGLLKDHPITRGRYKEERISRVVTFGGESLKAADDSHAFLVLSPTAVDLFPDNVKQSAAGRAGGIAMSWDTGRLVVLGEAAMLTAQLFPESVPLRDRRKGMNRPGNDNKQLTLNIMHWLSGLLR